MSSGTIWKSVGIARERCSPRMGCGAVEQGKPVRVEQQALLSLVADRIRVRERQLSGFDVFEFGVEPGGPVVSPVQRGCAERRPVPVVDPP
jgi:hypothetical protein